MGVPIITLPGSRAVSRQTHSILKTIGHEEWSASSIEVYVEIASALAADVGKRRALMKSLRWEIAHSPVVRCTVIRRAAGEIYLQVARPKEVNKLCK